MWRTIKKALTKVKPLFKILYCARAGVWNLNSLAAVVHKHTLPTHKGSCIPFAFLSSFVFVRHLTQSSWCGAANRDYLRMKTKIN